MDAYKANYEDLLSADKFYTKEEILSKFGSKYKLEIQNALLIKDEELFHKYSKENLIKYKDKEVSEDLLLDLINNPAMFGYLLQNINNTSKNSDDVVVKILYIDEDGYVDNNKIIIKRYEIIKLLQMLDKSKIKTLTFQAWIENFTDEEALRIAYLNKVEDFYINGKTKKQKITDLLDILFIDDNSFNNFIQNNSHKKELIYMLINFIETNQILEKYELSRTSYERYMSLRNNELIDIESINADRKLFDPDNYDNKVLSQIELDPELISFIENGLDETYSKTEKAIHIYIKLCMLIKDNPNIIYTQKGIDVKDNLYNFSLVYAALLGRYNIMKKLNRDETLETVSSVKVISDEYIILARSEMSINDDLLTCLGNLNSINNNSVTKKVFTEKIYKVYSNLSELNIRKEKFDEASKQYELKNRVSIKDELMLILELITSSELKGPELIDYEKSLLSKISNQDILTYSFMCDNKANKYFEYEIISIVSLYIKNDYHYFILNSNDHTLKEVSKGYLYEKIVAGDYSYINANETGVPGLGLESVIKYVR